MKELLETVRLTNAVVRLSYDWRLRPVIEEDDLLKNFNEKISKLCPGVPRIGIHSKKARLVEYSFGGELKVKAVVRETVYSIGAISTSIEFESALISSQLDAEELSKRINRGSHFIEEDNFAEAFVDSKEVLIRTPCDEVIVPFEEHPPSKLAIELVLAKSIVFISPMKALSSRESVLISLFLLSHRIWSSKRFIKDEIFLNTYRKLAEAINIGEKYDSFVKSVLFLKDANSFYWVLEAIRDLAFLSIGPPECSWLLFSPPLHFLNSLNSRILNALATKEALDSLKVKPKRASWILVSEFCPKEEGNVKRRRLLESLCRRDPSKGLTVSELARLVGGDWKTIKRSLEVLMKLGLVLCGSTSKYSGKGRPPDFYMVNTESPFIKNLLHGVLLKAGMRR